MKYIDLTHTFNSSMPVYPGDPASELIQISSLEKEGYIDHQIKTAMHVGTHIDAPLHMIEKGKRISEMDVGQFFGTGRLVDTRGFNTIDLPLLQQANIDTGSIVLIMTGFSEKYGTAEYYNSYPELTETAARYFIDQGVKMVGIDGPSPDRAPYAIHKLLLGAGILIIENLTDLKELLKTEFEVIALPLHIEADAGLARVIAKIE